MNNPNHPNFLNFNTDNVHLLNTMLLGTADKNNVMQYQHYTNVNAAMHPMNLATTTSAAGPSVVQTTTIDPVQLVYQHSQHNEALLLQHQQQQQQQQQHQQLVQHQHMQQQQQHPISYKIPQLSQVVAAVAHMPAVLAAAPVVTSSSIINKKKDIVAEAIRAADTMAEVKKEPPPTSTTPAPSIPMATAVKSEPSTSADNKTSPMNRPGPKPGTSSSSSTRGRGSFSRGGGNIGGAAARQQIMPRLQLLDDEDDGVTCRMCLQPFWYKSQLHDHLKAVHSISDPERYEKEEREKKLRRLREEQHRIAMAQRGRGGNPGLVRGRGGMLMRGRGGTLSRGGGMKRPMVAPGPKPSFQYNDGSFICDLCQKKFSDGNDMVTHWKLHVKQYKATAGSSAGSPSSAGGSPSPGGGRGRGRPPGARGSGRGRGRGARMRNTSGETVKVARRDKGKPRWTAYLLWSTRRRKELTAENEGYTFAQIGRTISEEWKKVEGEALDKLKEEAERLNFEGVKKLPKDAASDTEEDDSEMSWSEDEDPSFDETNVKKPIMLKIKREKSERVGRQRKRPSFFQDYENEENNLDKILDEFEQEQILEARQPREPKPKAAPKNPGSRPRKRKEPSPSILDDDKEIELETSRSGRVRKIRRRKVFAFDEEEEESNSDDEDRDEYQPDSEPEEPPEEYLDLPPSADEESEPDTDEDGFPLPIKKRFGEHMTKEEIEEAKRAAFAAKPQIVVDTKKLKGKDYRDEIDRIITPGEDDNLEFESDDELSQVLKMQVKKEPEGEPAMVKPEVMEGDLPQDKSEEAASAAVPEDVSLNTPISNPQVEDIMDPESAAAPPSEDLVVKPPEGEPLEAQEGGGDLEGSVTEEAPQHFDSDNEVVDDEPVADQSTPPSDETLIEQRPLPEPIEDTSSAAVAFSDVTDNVQENGGHSPQQETPLLAPPKETSAEEDLLTSTEATNMEEGDEQYKNIIAESQMDNIFN